MKNVHTINEIREMLLPIFTSNPIEKAILFGSYAKGVATPLSDIDIMIDSNGQVRGIDFFGIRGELSDVLEKDVDLIEASQLVDGGRIQREIEKTGVVIYEKA